MPSFKDARTAQAASTHKMDPETDVTARSPSDSSHIEVQLSSTPEEELYAAAEAMHTRASLAADATATSPVTAAASGSGAQDCSNSGGAGAEADAGEPFAFDSDMSRYPASMTSSVRDHVYEGGIRYHAYRSGKYAFPNDEVEQNRDDMKHTMTLMLCRGAFFYSPVEQVLEAGGEVLDLGESCCTVPSFATKRVALTATAHDRHWDGNLGHRA